MPFPKKRKDLYYNEVFIVKSISFSELEKISDSNSEIIDIRDHYSYQLGSYPRAIHIPSNFLYAMPEKYLERKKRYYLFCEYGSKSKKMVQYLSRIGYDVYNVEGGYQSYKK